MEKNRAPESPEQAAEAKPGSLQPPGSVKNISLGRALLALGLAILLWFTLKQGLDALGTSRWLSIGIASFGVLAVAVFIIRRSLRKQLVTLNFLDKLTEAETLDEIITAIRGNPKLSRFSIDLITESEARNQAIRVVALALESGSETEDQSQRLIDELEYNPRLPLRSAFSPTNTLTDEQNERLIETLQAIDLGDRDLLEAIIPPFRDLMNGYENPIDANWRDISSVVIRALLARGTDQDIDEAEHIIMRRRYIFTALAPLEQLDLRLQMAGSLMRQSVSPEYTTVIRVRQQLEEAEKFSSGLPSPIQCRVYIAWCDFYLWHEEIDRDSGGIQAAEHLEQAIAYGERASELIGQPEWNQFEGLDVLEADLYSKLGLAYRQYANLDGKRSEGSLRQAVSYFERGAASVDPTSEEYQILMGQLSLTQLMLADYESDLDQVGRENLLSVLDNVGTMSINTRNMVNLLTLVRSVASLYLERRYFSGARSLFDWQLQLIEKSSIRETVDKLMVDKITHDVAETCAYLCCLESDYHRAMEILERKRTYYFRDEPLATQHIEETVRATLRAGVTPVYLIVTNLGSYALIVSEASGQTDSPYSVDQVRIDDFQMRDIYADLILAGDFLTDFKKRWKMLKSLTPLMQPVADRLSSMDSEHTVFLTSGFIAQFPLSAVEVSVDSGTAWILERFTCSFLPALSTQRTRAEAVSESRGAIVVGSSAEDLSLSSYAAGVVSDILERSALIADVRSHPEGKISTADFLTSLRQSELLHFDGHGRLDLGDPLDSKLELADGEAVTGYDLQGLSEFPDCGLTLAVLSACDSATTSTHQLQDEGASLSLGFLVSTGCATAIGTMWPVGEKAALIIVRMFYEKLLELGSLLASTEALRLTQTELRSITVGQLLEKIRSWPGMADKLGADVMAYLDSEPPTARPSALLNVDQTGAFVAVGVPRLRGEMKNG